MQSYPGCSLLVCSTTWAIVVYRSESCTIPLDVGDPKSLYRSAVALTLSFEKNASEARSNTRFKLKISPLAGPH